VNGQPQVRVAVVGPEDWALWRELRLEVHEDNAPAALAYDRLGFVATGERRPYVLDPARSLIEMCGQF